jgi:hypothetical protein
MNSSSIFPFSAKLIAELKVRLVKSSQHWLPKLGLCVLSLSGVTLQAYASNPSAPSADSSATKVAESKFDLSKVPPVTPMPRPGLFIMPPTSPGYYSLWDMVTGNKREKPPVAPYAPFALLPTSAFDIDFRYLDNPEHEKDFFDPVKRMYLGNDWLLSFGGNFWHRYVHETDSRLTDTNNDFNLLRTRFHADLWYQDRVRLFAEFIDARTFGYDLPPLTTDRNYTDMLNLFTDIKLSSVNNGPVYVRVGRQELLYGSQRLLSTLDWANTRRTFQGVKTFWRTPTWDLDAFWVRPMIIEKGNFDNWDTQQNFYGLWATHKPKPGHLVDLYFLSLDNNRNLTAANITQGNILQGNSIVHTLGGRLAGNIDNFLYELEGMYQFGQRSNLDVSAFAVATGVGYRLPMPMNPQAWIRYDFASGDNNPNDGKSNTFNQLFPFGHYYLGFMDRVGRQNVHDLNAQFTLHPAPWVTFISQYHRFYLADNRDYLYNAAGQATFRDITGASGSHIGDEIDFRMNFHVSRHQDVLVGYSKLFTGNFLENQRPGIHPDLVYVQYNIRF